MEIKNGNVLAENCDAIIVNMFEGGKTSLSLANDFVVEKDKFDGKFKNTYVLNTMDKIKPKKIIVVGFDKENEFDANKLREATAKAVAKAISIKAKTICIDYKVNFDWANQAVIGAEIANYSFDEYKTKKNDRFETLILPEGINFEKGKILAEAMTFSRNLSNQPASYATPTKLAEIAQSLDGIETEIFEEKQIKEMGMNAFLAVAQGSCQPPKFIHMKYIPQNPKKRIAIIGKGICFDSGGLDIKPASSMITMKDDMSAAASVLAIMRALKELKPNVEVHGIIAACENMPSGNSYKPGDILRAKNGKTIEVDNTDAEGRLTLADALCYASELNVDEVIDIATLTGACVVALGSVASGIMGNDEKMVKNLIDTAEKSGEKYWELPLFEEYMDNFKSDVADMKNTGARWGGASGAGVFLQNFVKDIKWVHIDVAGTAFIDTPYKEFIKGSTGIAVRPILNYLLK